MNAQRVIQFLAIIMLVGAIVIAFGNFSKTDDYAYPQKYNPSPIIQPVHDNPGNHNTDLLNIA